MLPYERIQFPAFVSNIPTTTGYDYFTASQAKDYFNWFMQIMPKRIEYMLSMCSAESGVSVDRLRIFPDGFLDIWRWFLTRQTLRDTTAEEIAAFERNGGHLLGETWVPKRILDETTECLHIDIGMFFGDQFIKHYPNDLEWNYFLKPKSDILVKAPVVCGFSKAYKKDGTIGSIRIDPVHSVGGQSRKIFADGTSENDLLRIAEELMSCVYDVDTKVTIPPLYI